MSNTQIILNIKLELKTVTFEKEEEWEKNVEKFHQLIAKLAPCDKPISMESKVSMFRRTLPTRFALIAMVAESSKMPFEKVIASVKAKISCLKTPEKSNKPAPVAASVNKTIVNDRKDERNWLKAKNDTCFVCGR